MAQKLILLTSLFFFISCSQKDPEEFLKYLNGYWEIEKVQTSDGKEKQYTFNQSIDFIEITDSVGVRKKLQPQIDGSFIRSKDAERFTIKIENDSLHLYYQTPLFTWRETVILAKENQMIVKNENGILYFYKTYEKMQL